MVCTCLTCSTFSLAASHCFLSDFVKQPSLAGELVSWRTVNDYFFYSYGKNYYYCRSCRLYLFVVVVSVAQRSVQLATYFEPRVKIIVEADVMFTLVAFKAIHVLFLSFFFVLFCLFGFLFFSLFHRKPKRSV